MHTITVIGGGFLLLLAVAMLGRWIGGPSATATAAKCFIPLRLIIALVNLWVGASRGYTVVQELPVLALVFELPAAFAAFLWWRRWAL